MVVIRLSGRLWNIQSWKHEFMHAYPNLIVLCAASWICVYAFCINNWISDRSIALLNPGFIYLRDWINLLPSKPLYCIHSELAFTLTLTHPPWFWFSCTHTQTHTHDLPHFLSLFTIWMNICHLDEVHAKSSYSITYNTHYTLTQGTAHYTPFNSIFNLIISTIAHALHTTTENGIICREVKHKTRQNKAGGNGGIDWKKIKMRTSKWLSMF